jgi:glycosyltransferase involved in cell wall biosynthesis
VLVGKGTQTLPRRANVIALGERHDLPAVYAAGDVVISSSAYGEGFSNTLAEGMACGLPAVGTDVGDARTIVGDTGVICPPRDVEALAEAARGLLKESPAARIRRSEAARRRIVESFSLDQAIAGFTQAYRDVVGAA